MGVFFVVFFFYFFFFFFFNDTATTEIYTLSLHDALPISFAPRSTSSSLVSVNWRSASSSSGPRRRRRSEEHTSELQSHVNLVCRLLLEKKKPTPAPDPERLPQNTLNP